MANNKISSSKKEIYTRLLDVAEKYIDIEKTDFLKTGLFGYITESMAMMMRDSTFHKSMLYNESFLNTAIIPKSVYNWAKMFNVEVQKATPAYATIEIRIPYNSVEMFLREGASEDLKKKYGSDVFNASNFLIINRDDPIEAGDYIFSLERSIILSKDNGKFKAKYISTETPSTTFQTITNGNYNLFVNNSDEENLIITARAYQYKKVTYTRQITSTSFLNKIQQFEFEDQFCGATLYYSEGSSLVKVPLKYSDLSASATEQSAFYNLSDEHELELIFKSGENYFIPSSNSKITLNIYCTKGANIPAKYSGDAFMRISDSDLRALPMVITFNPTNLIGGKNMPTLTEIKQTIINEISTRNTITTKTDLNNYFQILTSLIEDINDGKVKFIKRRDDVIKRIYNAYLLLRDNTNESDGTVAEANYLSPCVPTNTFNAVKITTTTGGFTNGSLNLSFPKFDGNGLYSTAVDSDYFISPFSIFISSKNVTNSTQKIDFVKYIYNLTDSESVLEYKDTTDFGADFSRLYYLTPASIHLKRGFNETGAADDKYQLTVAFNTNFSIGNEKSDNKATLGGKIVVKGVENSSTIEVNISDTTLKSTQLEDASYLSEITIPLSVDDPEFEYNTDFCNVIHVNGKIFYSSERLEIDMSGVSVNNELIGGSENAGGVTVFQSVDKMVFYQELDDIMESSVSIKQDTNGTNTIIITEVPVIHSSFFKQTLAGNTTTYTNRREGFIKQLFTYIQILKENIDKLETSTFFNLKFFNTYGASRIYNTASTNLKVEFDITLNSDIYYTNDDLKNEIRSYIRKIVDRMNEQNAISISTITSLLTNTSTYGKYIDHITFIGLNDSFTQHITLNETTLTEDEIKYPPEWLNIQPEDLVENITFSKITY